jgi:5-methylcytosine-specific restriction endonuclease McrBC regulatory subunit McrC
VRPRFGWSGVGSILSETGWHSAPNILSMPLVPGSGREVPPWVLAGPVIARLRALLEQLKRGFDFKEDTRQAPRGTIQWARYVRTSLPSGRWHHVPCRYPDLSTDPLLRGAIRWTLERVLEELGVVGGDDRVALGLRHEAVRLLDRLRDVARVYPRPAMIARMSGGDPLVAETVRSGLEAIGWVRDERGLGGGRQMDGLAWALPLDQLWEDHVAAKVRERVRQEGGVLRLGRRGETVTPLHWSDSSHGSLGHLVPDIVVRRRDSVWIVDAKYKAHFAEIDESGWRQMADEIRERHRADVHQILGYTALFDAPEIVATLAYPLRRDTWEGLVSRGSERIVADVYNSGRHVRLELWGMPFSAHARGVN